jgi:hypothetical protein
MFVNFRARWISRGARKLIQTFMLIKKKNIRCCWFIRFEPHLQQHFDHGVVSKLFSVPVGRKANRLFSKNSHDRLVKFINPIFFLSVNPLFLH